jgi:hypothetical protein
MYIHTPSCSAAEGSIATAVAAAFVSAVGTCPAAAFPTAKAEERPQDEPDEHEDDDEHPPSSHGICEPQDGSDDCGDNERQNTSHQPVLAFV